MVHQMRRRVGAELGEPDRGAAEVAGAREHGLAETVDALGGHTEAQPRPEQAR